MKEWIYNLNEPAAGRQSLAGGKARSLHQLIRAGLPVPGGVVISTAAYDSLILNNSRLQKTITHTGKVPAGEIPGNPKTIISEMSFPDVEKLWEEVSVLLNKDCKHLILRSSATVEDSSDTSFAGIFESILNVSNKSGFAEALRLIYAAAFDDRVLEYCKRQNIEHHKIKMAVVVQQMIPSEKSGVVFSMNPLTANDRELSIEAIHGMGEALVQGTVTPDAILYNWQSDIVNFERTGEQDRWLQAGEPHLKELENPGPVLSEEEVSELGELCLQVQAHYGQPQDIEWAWTAGKFYIVQARPITSYRYAGQEAWTNADFKDGGVSSGVATPLMLSMYKDILETSMPHYLRSVNLYPSYHPPSWGLIRFSILYWNMKAVKNGVMKIPGFTERQFDDDLGIEPDYEGTGRKTKISLRSVINGIKILISTNRSIRRRPIINTRILEKIKAVLEEFHQIKLESLSDRELAKYARSMFTNHYHEMEAGYFSTIYDNSNCKTLFSEKLDKYNKKRSEKADYLKLVAGIHNVSHLRPIKALWRLRKIMNEDPKQLEAFEQLTADELAKKHISGNDYSFRPEIEDFLENYGYHSQHELDISKPHWKESPQPVFHHLKSILELPTEHEPHKGWERQHQQFLSQFRALRSRSVQKSLRQHRNMLWWREEMRDYSTRMYFVLRQLSLEMGSRLVRGKKIDDLEDVFFLPYNDLLELAEGADPQECRKAIKKNRIYYRSFRNFPLPDELIPSAGISGPTQEYQGDFKGIPCSSGVVSAKISVVTDVAQLAEVKEGEILVTRFTDPAWTPVFSRISGLVTETGGTLSHGAIVSREYGIPAVLGVKNAREHLRTGMKIELDGNTGSIKILSDA